MMYFVDVLITKKFQVVIEAGSDVDAVQRALANDYSMTDVSKVETEVHANVLVCK